MALPMWMNRNKQTVRSDVNPLDKSTIVSIYPKEIVEVKHTIQPGKFIIPAGSFDKPGVLVIGSSSWWREIDEDQPLLEIPQSSVAIANSIIKDLVNSLLGSNGADRMPGLFFVTGSKTSEQIKKDHSDLLLVAREKQKKYFETAVFIADSLWARTNGNPLSISDVARLAARELNLNDKGWLQDYQAIAQIKCTACGSLRNPEFPICPTCKSVIDVDLAKKLNLKFASG
jgi:hypothetical protein